MIEVKGLDSVVAGRIGKYVVCKGNLSRCLYIELIKKHYRTAILFL